MKKYEVLLFDLDDTLIDNYESVRYAFRKMVEFVGEEYTESGLKRWYYLDKKFWIDFHDGKIIVPEEYTVSQDLFIEYIRSLRYIMYFKGKIDLKMAFEVNRVFLKSLEECIVAIDGAYETIKELHEKYRLVIATNGPSSAVNSKLVAIDCLQFFESIFSADMTENTVTKPSIKYFEELKKYLQYYKKDGMLVIGDSLRSDIQGAMNWKIDSCWFNPNKEPLPSQYKPTMIINNLIELTKRI